MCQLMGRHTMYVLHGLIYWESYSPTCLSNLSTPTYVRCTNLNKLICSQMFGFLYKRPVIWLHCSGITVYFLHLYILWEYVILLRRGPVFQKYPPLQLIFRNKRLVHLWIEQWQMKESVLHNSSWMWVCISCAIEIF